MSLFDGNFSEPGQMDALSLLAKSNPNSGLATVYKQQQDALPVNYGSLMEAVQNAMKAQSLLNPVQITPSANPNSFVSPQYMREQGATASSEDSFAPMRAYQALKGQGSSALNSPVAQSSSAGGK